MTTYRFSQFLTNITDLKSTSCGKHLNIRNIKPVATLKQEFAKIERSI